MAFLVSGLTAFAAPKAKTVTVTTGAEFINITEEYFHSEQALG